MLAATYRPELTAEENAAVEQYRPKFNDAVLLVGRPHLTL